MHRSRVDRRIILNHRTIARTGSLALLALVAGCGLSPVVSRTSVPASAVQTRATAFDFKGISVDGKIVTSFSMFDGGAVRLRAEVSNPSREALTYRWDSTGSYLQLPEGNELSWFGRAGRHTVTCTVRNAAGQALTKQMNITVWAVPTPPPFPPNPFPPVPFPPQPRP